MFFGSKNAYLTEAVLTGSLAVDECSECLGEIAAVLGEQPLGLRSRNLEFVHLQHGLSCRAGGCIVATHDQIDVFPLGVDWFFHWLDRLAIQHELP